MKKALFAGCFDPPTFGHLDIIERASKLCDSLTVAVAVNSTKKSLLSIEKRVKLLKELTKPFSQVTVEAFSGLTSQMAKQRGFQLFIRALRDEADCDHELSLARANRHLAGLETILIPSDERYLYISSSLVREIHLNGGPLEKFVPASVAAALKDVR